MILEHWRPVELPDDHRGGPAPVVLVLVPEDQVRDGDLLTIRA